MRGLMQQDSMKQLKHPAVVSLQGSGSARAAGVSWPWGPVTSQATVAWSQHASCKKRTATEALLLL